MCIWASGFKAGGLGMADLGERTPVNMEALAYRQHLAFPKSETNHLRGSSFAGDRSQSLRLGSERV